MIYLKGVAFRLRIVSLQFSSVQSLSHVWFFVTPWTTAHQPPCPSPTPRVHSDSRPSSRWCHPAISSSVIPFSSCLQSFPASGCFQMSQLFASGGQSIGVSASTSVLPMNIQDWFPILQQETENKCTNKKIREVPTVMWKWKWKWSCLVVSDSLRSHGL